VIRSIYDKAFKLEKHVNLLSMWSTSHDGLPTLSIVRADMIYTHGYNLTNILVPIILEELYSELEELPDFLI